MSMNIAIDGPAGAGKSTIAKRLAKKLGFSYVDTGAMYRAMAYYFLQHNIDAKDENAIAAACPDVDVTITYENGEQQVLLNGENVNGVIRNEEVGNMASSTSVYPVVRKKLVELQRQLAKSADVIMDGRDIGTVVLPHADLKIYQIASVETRAKRRYLENKERGLEADLETIKKEIEQRDYQDMHRAISPLKKADDAIELDTSNMTLEEVVDQVLTLINKTREE